MIPMGLAWLGVSRGAIGCAQPRTASRSDVDGPHAFAGPPLCAWCAPSLVGVAAGCVMAAGL